MMASSIDPLTFAQQSLQLTKMWGSLAEILDGSKPTVEDVMKLSSAAEILGAMCSAGICSDPLGLIKDAREALEACGQRGLNNGGVFRLTGPGTLAVRAMLQDYSEALPKISARCAIHCHRLAEKKVKSGKF